MCGKFFCGEVYNISNCLTTLTKTKCYTVSRDGAVFSWECDRLLKDFKVGIDKRKHEDSGSEEEITEEGWYVTIL